MTKERNKGNIQPRVAPDTCLTLSRSSTFALAIQEDLDPTGVSSRNSITSSVASSFHSHLTDGALGCSHLQSFPIFFHNFRMIVLFACLLSRIYYPATCSPKGHGSVSAAAEATAVALTGIPSQPTCAA